MSIRDLMPFVKQWSPEVMNALQLSDHEIARFTLDGSVLRKYTVQMDGKLPTCLHAWGNQADACPCGCRSSGFQDHVIQQRGIYAQLLPVPVESGSCLYRHLHPMELAILNGLLPPSSWDPADAQNLRLKLCAIGQLASPIQSVWVGSCIVQQLQAYFDLPQDDPADCLRRYKSLLHAKAQQLFPSVASPVVVPGVTRLVYPDGTSTQVQVTSGTTLVELFQADDRCSPLHVLVALLREVFAEPLSLRSCFTSF